MKKHSFLFCLLLSLITLPQFALGECSKLFAEGYNSSGWGRQAYIEAVKGGKQFWGCGKDDGMCDDNDVVPQLDTNGKIIALYQCDRNNFGAKNKFNDFSVNIWCKESEIKTTEYDPIDIVNLEDSTNNLSDNENLKGIEAYYSTKDAQDTSRYEVGNITVFTGTNYCIFAKCKSGYLPNSERNGCVPDNRKTNCTNTGGTWSEGKCNCAANKNIKTTDNLVCECISTNYEWKSDKKQGCKLTAAAQQRIQGEQNAAQCTKSGGRWLNNDCVCDKNKYLKQIGKVCKCKDGYDYINQNDTSQGCEMTAATQNAQNKDKCEKSKAAGQPVKWGDNGCYCIGLDGQYEINDAGQIYECEETKDYSACIKLGSSVAYWDEDKRTCRCTDTNKQFRNGNCNTNTDAYQQSLDTTAAVAEIEKLGKELNDISATFDRSKWRDADGKFNTARLASDSVAAVVLGTAGGLISSKVIKKKQVENGFEDIKCTIGSQEVANWGDEFQVGIQ